ncbi:MAG TPA: AIR synthase related protein [bacterium]|mgnify:CR=1 FL=1|nr:AIR synthase related protein [bacterium]HOX87407.1 AIR synthase related protein [bacterium]HPG46868.1 AIR synthase related protein [bacterium]HPM99152.1 AIR synthase related protein [bacterium]
MAIEFERLFSGKLPPNLMELLIDRYTHQPPEILIGAQLGEDATVIDQGDTFLLVKTDPITFTSEQIGVYAVQINANDIYCMGGRPRWFLSTILLPENCATRKMADEIFSQISQTCEQMGVAYCGGHTEVTVDLNRPIVVGQMLGTAGRHELLDKRTVAVGDHLLVFREVPLEGTVILATQFAKKVRKLFSAELGEKCRSLLYEPGLNVGPIVELVRESGTVHALHDPTEGGLATALMEITRPSGLFVDVTYEAIPILPEGKLLCDEFGLDPLGTLSSGALLAAVPEKAVKEILTRCEAQGVIASDIGLVHEEESGHILRTDGTAAPLPVFIRDEIVKIWR